MWRYICLMVSAIALAVGCRPSTVADSDSFGRFIGDVVASWHPNGREMTLQQTFIYVDPADREWIAPAGAVIDGASIPSAFWSIIGSPFAGKYRNASVVHDVGCVEMRQSWEDVHRMFYVACRCAGVDEFQAKTMYYAVYHFGPRWQPIVETVLEPRATGDGQVSMQEVAVRRMARIDPPPPTAEEISQIEAYVAEENPNPEAIEKLGREQLRHRPTKSGRSSPPAKAARDRATHQERGRSRSSTAQRGNDAAAVAPSEDDVIAVVRQHIEGQAGEARPARFSVESTRGVYRVHVQYLVEDDQGQWAEQGGAMSSALVSRHGQLLEFINRP
jgi:hypothetical protein